jgi:hypothetical protein
LTGIRVPSPHSARQRSLHDPWVTLPSVLVSLNVPPPIQGETRGPWFWATEPDPARWLARSLGASCGGGASSMRQESSGATQKPVGCQNPGHLIDQRFRAVRKCGPVPPRLDPMSRSVTPLSLQVSIPDARTNSPRSGADGDVGHPQARASIAAATTTRECWSPAVSGLDTPQGPARGGTCHRGSRS